MLTLVIVNWNTKEDLRRCLASVAGHPPEGQWEAVVVDNGSEDGSAEMVRSEFGWVSLRAEGTNLGYAAATNRVLKEAPGDVVLLNPDTEFVDDTLRRLGKWEGRVGAVAGRLIDIDSGATQPSIRRFPRPLWILLDAFGIGPYRCRNFDYDQPAAVEQPMATFLWVRKEALGEVGLLDEEFPIFFNDVDFLYRMRRSGWEVRYEPSLRVKHVGGSSTRRVRKAMIWESHKSLIRYWLKWHFHWWNALFMVPLFCAVLLAAVIRAKGIHAGFRP